MRKVFLALSTFQNISIFYQYRRAKSTIKLLSVTTWIIFMTTSQFLRVLQYSSQIVETGAICLEFSPNFLHSRLTPLFSVRSVALLPQCWAERILEHWNDCKSKSTLGREKSHKCFKICEEDCSLVFSFVSFFTHQVTSSHSISLIS